MKTLATLDTISRWEKEINSLGGYTEQWGIASPSAEALVTIRSAVGTKLLMRNAIGIITESAIIDNVANVPVAQIIAFDLYDGGTLLDTFLLNEGQGVDLFGQNGGVCDISSASAWLVCQATRTWQDKVDLAHIVVENDILTNLYNRLSKYTDTEIMDGITNIETMAIPVDMKSLELIYTDLANSGFNQMYQAKAADYARRYNTEFRSALQRLNVDIDGTGVEPNRIVTQGVLSR